MRGELRQAIKSAGPNEAIRDFSHHSELIAVVAPPLVCTEDVIALTGLQRLEPVHTSLPADEQAVPPEKIEELQSIADEVRAGKFLYSMLQTDSFWGLRPTPDMLAKQNHQYIVQASLPAYHGLKNGNSHLGDDIRGAYVVARAWELWQKNIITENIPEAESLVRKALEERSLYFILETEPPDEAANDLRLFAEHRSANHNSHKESIAREAARRLLTGLLPQLNSAVFENSRPANPRAV